MSGWRLIARLQVSFLQRESRWLIQGRHLLLCLCLLVFIVALPVGQCRESPTNLECLLHFQSCPSSYMIPIFAFHLNAVVMLSVAANATCRPSQTCDIRGKLEYVIGLRRWSVPFFSCRGFLLLVQCPLFQIDGKIFGRPTVNNWIRHVYYSSWLYCPWCAIAFSNRFCPCLSLAWKSNSF